jgi:hypothetical protein
MSWKMGLPQDIMFAAEETAPTINSPYPAQTKQASTQINGVATEVMSIFFSDRIMISISQEGRLAQWVTNGLNVETDRQMKSDEPLDQLSVVTV